MRCFKSDEKKVPLVVRRPSDNLEQAVIAAELVRELRRMVLVCSAVVCPAKDE